MIITGTTYTTLQLQTIMRLTKFPRIIKYWNEAEGTERPQTTITFRLKIKKYVGQNADGSEKYEESFATEEKDLRFV